MITIKDVAKKANVSTATVSRVLNNIGYIKDSTYKNVLNAAEELGYVMNNTAKQLKTNSSKVVGFIISDINNSYYFNILSELKNKLKEDGYELIVTFSAENPKDEERSFRSLIASRVSVILFTPVCKTNNSIIEIAQKNDIVVIQLFRDIYPNLLTIINDDEGGCRDSATILINNGCKNILLIDVEYPFMDFNLVKPNRSSGFLKALNGHDDVSYKIINYPIIDYDKQRLYDIIDQMNPDGIIAANNHFGFLVLSYLKKRNKHIKLISFDDNEWFKLESITAVKQNSNVLIDTIHCYICADQPLERKAIVPQTVNFRQIKI